MVALGFAKNETVTAENFINALISNGFVALPPSKTTSRISKFGFNYANSTSANVTFGDITIPISGFICEFSTNLPRLINDDGTASTYNQVLIDLISIKTTSQKTNYRIRGYTNNTSIFSWSVTTYEL